MKITPVSRTLLDIFGSTFIRIPRFQRAYDWDNENIVEFWIDLISDETTSHFMGSIVVYVDSKEENVLYIVDGQQRITTIAITLAAVRDKFLELGDQDKARGIQRYIENRDLDDKKRYTLEHEPKSKFFQNAVQAYEVNSDFSTSTDQEQRLGVAQKVLKSSLAKHIDEIANKSAKIKELNRLRDKILKLQFISITLDNEDDAYLIFETLNTRGKDLRVSDLAKNLFTKYIKPTAKNHDTAVDNWTDILKLFESVSAKVEVDSFLLHYWLAQEEFISKARLYKDFKSKVKKSNAKERLVDLKDAAETYIHIIAPNETKWTKEELPLKRSLRAISVFRVAQALPLILSVMRKYRSKVISLSQAKNAISSIEKFTFQFNAVTSSRGGGGISNMYAKLAQAVFKVSDANEFGNVLRDIKAKFRERVPSEDEFAVAFSTITYRNDFTRDKNLVRYILTKFMEKWENHTSQDYEIMTIEHILSQSKGKVTDDADDVGAIGNLIFVPEEINAELKTDQFDQKQAKLIERSVPMDDYLKAATSWSQKKIARRGVKLAMEGYNDIWAI